MWPTNMLQVGEEGTLAFIAITRRLWLDVATTLAISSKPATVIPA